MYYYTGVKFGLSIERDGKDMNQTFDMCVWKNVKNRIDW